MVNGQWSQNSKWVLRSDLDGGMPLEPQNPYPFWQEMVPIFRDFSQRRSLDPKIWKFCQ